MSVHDIRLLHRERLATLGSLAGELAHEFNNIMTSVLLHSQVALLEAEAASGLARDLTLIVVGVERARNLVNGILSFGGEIHEQEPCVFSLRSAVDASLLVLSTIAPGARIVLTTCAETDYVLGDPGLLHEVVMGLCLQGGKPPPAALALTLRRRAQGAHTESDGPYVLLEITGGHELDDRKLSSVRGIVRRMNGSLHLDSSLDGGVTVRICLPAAQAPSQGPCELSASAG